MDHSYWLARRDSSARYARLAADGKTRLIHLDLAGRYSVKAAAASDEGSGGAECDEAARYERLEIGARWLASGTRDGEEKQAHLGAANRYARLRVAAARGGRR